MKAIDIDTLDRALDSDSDLIERTMQRAVRDAMRKHKRLGQPVVVWKDGKTVWLHPDEIEVIDESEEEDLLTEGRNGDGRHTNEANDNCK